MVRFAYPSPAFPLVCAGCGEALATPNGHRCRVSERSVSEQDRTLGDTSRVGKGRSVMGGAPPRHPNVRYVGDVLPSGRRVYSVSPTYYQCG